MDASTIGLITGIISAAFWLANLGLLVWVVVAGRSSAKKLTIIGMALGLTTILVGLLAGYLYAYMGPTTAIISPLLGGIIGLAANFMRTKAFLDADKVAAQSESGFAAGTWRSGAPQGGRPPAAAGGPRPGPQPGGPSPQGYGPQGYGQQGHGPQGPGTQGPGQPPAGWGPQPGR